MMILANITGKRYVGYLYQYAQAGVGEKYDIHFVAGYARSGYLTPRPRASRDPEAL